MIFDLKVKAVIVTACGGLDQTLSAGGETVYAPALCSGAVNETTSAPARPAGVVASNSCDWLVAGQTTSSQPRQSAVAMGGHRRAQAWHGLGLLLPFGQWKISIWDRCFGWVLVQQPDQIAARFAITIEPYWLGLTGGCLVTFAFL